MLAYLHGAKILLSYIKPQACNIQTHPKYKKQFKNKTTILHTLPAHPKRIKPWTIKPESTR